MDVVDLRAKWVFDRHRSELLINHEFEKSFRSIVPVVAGSALIK